MRIDATRSGGVGTINGFALSVSAVRHGGSRPNQAAPAGRHV
jgi:hypothetical protein